VGPNNRFQGRPPLRGVRPEPKRWTTVNTRMESQQSHHLLVERDWMSLRERATDRRFTADLASLRPHRSAMATSTLERRSGSVRFRALSRILHGQVASRRQTFAGPRLRARVASVVVTPATRFREELSSNNRFQGRPPLRGVRPEPKR
jgi:hypothetical protein